MPKTVRLHVGIAKTGTTYLQNTLFANRALLARHGTLYPGETAGAHFLASLDLRQTTFKGHAYDDLPGAWDRLTKAANAFTGDVLVSHETLAHAKPEHIERALGSFAADRLEIVVTARDLGRQIPAVWQEQVKNRNETPYETFLDKAFTAAREGRRGEGGLWRVQDVASVVERWGAGVGRNAVTVVTVPPSGADRQELWRRFAAATVLPDLDYVFPEVSNSSLGVAEAELLRRMNAHFADLEWPRYERLVKRRLSESVLAPRSAAGRLEVPQSHWAEVDGMARRQVERLSSLGVTVVGNLDDLLPQWPDLPGRQPADLTDAELLEACVAVAASLAVSPPPNPRTGSAGLRHALKSRSPRSLAGAAYRRLRRHLP